MTTRRQDVSLLPGRARTGDVRLLGGDAAATSRPADNLWYRFIVTDGTDTDYYGDNTAALDGGLGATTDDAVDHSWALMVYVPGLHGARLGEGRGDLPDLPRPLPQRPHQQRPEDRRRPLRRPGADAALGHDARGLLPQLRRRRTNCPWRFDTTPPPDSPTIEQPRGRDYMGGDLKGVDQQLDYLQSLGVNTIYFNPIFDAGSNHSLRHAGLHEDRPVLRHAEGLGEPRQARRRARDPHHPRRRVQPHVVRQPVLRPLPPLRDVGRLRVADLAVSHVVHLHDVAAGNGTCAGTGGATRRPTTAGSASTRSRC